MVGPHTVVNFSQRQCDAVPFKILRSGFYEIECIGKGVRNSTSQILGFKMHFLDLTASIERDISLRFSDSHTG